MPLTLGAGSGAKEGVLTVEVRGWNVAPMGCSRTDEGSGFSDGKGAVGAS